jgi:hypothetical protein
MGVGTCRGCHKPIEHEQTVIVFCDIVWHETCFIPDSAKKMKVA